MDPKRSFSPRELQALDEAYHRALGKLLTRFPESDGQTKEALRRKIAQLASYKILEPETLGDLALDQLVVAQGTGQRVRLRRA